MNGISVERALRTADGQTPGEHVGEAGKAPGRELNVNISGRKLGLLDFGDGGRVPLAGHGTPSMALPNATLAVAHDPYHPRSEGIRALRTELLLRHDTQDRANLLALLSQGQGEGRTLLAAELAISFAQLGRRTLLVDADLRCPGQHKLFGLVNNHGLARVLMHEEPALLHPVKGQREMYVLNAGCSPGNIPELLCDERFEYLVNQWRSEFDCVVFDTPPLSECTDALAVATVVGRVITVSRAHRTSHRDMREMLRRLAATQAHILGAVISNF